MIHNIANRQIASLTNCESEPIHVPGSIQPFGFLIAIRQKDYQIEYCSSNAGDFTGRTPEQLLDQPLSVLFGKEQMDQLGAYLSSEERKASYPLSVSLKDQVYSLHAQYSGEFIIFELEPKPEEEITLPRLYGQMERFAASAENAGTLQELCQMVTGEIREITGFDRVMIYRFDEAYNGAVIAESRNETVEPFLNLHYPHSDIPVQARQLYLKNLVRLIADVSYKPAAILTLNKYADHNSLDLSHTVLRSVSPIHVEYLKNMGVNASFSVSLVHEGRLWGLIACHHYSAKVLPHHTRLSAQLQGHFLTSQIRVQQSKDAYERTRAAEAHLQHLQKAILGADDFIGEIRNDYHLLQMVGATGALIVQDGKMHRQGDLPEEEPLKDLAINASL